MPVAENPGGRRLLPSEEVVGRGCRVGVSRHQGRSVPVHLPHAALFRNHLIVAKTRRGKSTLLQHLAAHLMRQIDSGRERLLLVVIDPHQDLAESVLSVVPPGLEGPGLSHQRTGDCRSRWHEQGRRRKPLRRGHGQGHHPESALQGFIRYDGKLFPGNHLPIVDPETWDAANRACGRMREADGVRFRDDHVHLLKGIAKCGVCGTTMTPYPAGKKDKDGKPYLYYACTSVTQDGSASTCPVRSVPAREFESLIKSVLIDLGSDAAVLQACVDAANREALVSVQELQERQRRNHDEIARLTTGIRRIIEIMKETDLLAPDVRAEYKQLIQEKERLTTAAEKLQMDIDRRQKKVLDVEVIRRSLVDFERLVNLLPVQDQKELFQLLLREVQVRPFDPAQDSPPDAAAGAFATKVRSKWYRVEITLHQLPGVGLGERFRGGSSDKRGSGSPNRVIFRKASNSMLPFTSIAVGREPMANGATVSPGMSHLNQRARPPRGSAFAPIR